MKWFYLRGFSAESKKKRMIVETIDFWDGLNQFLIKGFAQLLITLEKSCASECNLIP